MVVVCGQCMLLKWLCHPELMTQQNGSRRGSMIILMMTRAFSNTVDSVYSPAFGTWGVGGRKVEGTWNVLNVNRTHLRSAGHAHAVGACELFVVGATCTYLSPRVSHAYGHCSPHHRVSHNDLSVLHWLWHPVVTERDGLQCLQWNNRVRRGYYKPIYPLSEQDNGRRHIKLRIPSSCRTCHLTECDH